MSRPALTRSCEDLETLCGTLTYLAPEVAKHLKSHSARDLRYTHAVDVWSLGVVIFQYAYGLPRPGSGKGLSWCRKIVKQLNDWDTDGLIDILSSMVVMDPQGRDSARKCLERALQLDRQTRSLTPTPDSYRDEQPLVEAKQSTVVQSSTLDREVLRLLQSDALVRTSIYVEKRKRSPQRSAASSASSGRRTKKTIAATSGKSPLYDESRSSSLAS